MHRHQPYQKQGAQRRYRLFREAFDNACYASCRAISHGVERWTSEKLWGPVNSGWLSGGHNRRDECNKLMAAVPGEATPDSAIELLPGEVRRQLVWEESKRDILGQVRVHVLMQGRYSIRAGLLREAVSGLRTLELTTLAKGATRSRSGDAGSNSRTDSKIKWGLLVRDIYAPQGANSH